MKNTTFKKSDIRNWFNSLKEETDLYYMALLTVSLFSKKKKYSNISELPIILDRDSFLNLITIYGGKTITIPTMFNLYIMFIIQKWRIYHIKKYWIIYV